VAFIGSYQREHLRPGIIAGNDGLCPPDLAFPDAAGIVAVDATMGGQTMPEIVIYAIGGRSDDQKKSLCKDITDAMVKNYKVPAEAVVITLVETPKTDKAKGGVMFSEMPAR
jgi:4-oxalocrotonate tautomerase